jgi:hypothetical protein
VNILLRQIALINFRHKEKRKKRGWGTKKSGTGVEVQIYKSGQTVRFPHAFIATGKRDQSGGGGNRHIFQRASRGGGSAFNAGASLVPRFPLNSLKGISLMREFQKSPEMQARVKNRIATEMDKELASQVNRLLNRRRTAATALP